jgi:hypothetical protein
MSQENVEVVRAWMRACNADDPESAVALCASAFEMTEPSTLPGAATTSGLDNLRRYFAGWQRNWSEWDWAYLFTLLDGKLLRQDGFDDKAQALEAVGPRGL